MSSRKMDEIISLEKGHARLWFVSTWSRCYGERAKIWTWDAMWALGLTGAAVRNAQIYGKKASGSNQKVISELDSLVLDGQRVGSGATVGDVKPIWGKNPKGKPVIEKEFPHVPKEDGFPNIVDNYPTGVFEWIVKPNGNISHRRFIDGGVLTGKQNQVPKK